jgi:hypothetical protein
MVGSQVRCNIGGLVPRVPGLNWNPRGNRERIKQEVNTRSSCYFESLYLHSFKFRVSLALS